MNRWLAVVLSGVMGTLLCTPVLANENAASVEAQSNDAALGDDTEVAARLSELAQANGALGTYFDFESSEYVVVFSDSDLVPPESSFKTLAIPLRVATRSITKGEIDEITNLLVNDRASKDAFGTFFSPRLGQVVVNAYGKPGTFDNISDRYPGLIDVRYEEGGRLSTRFNDSAPHWGAAWVESPGHGHCTSGFTVKENSTGIKRMATAAHCADGFGSDIFGGTSLFWGTITAYGPFPVWDLALIGGSHAGKIYTGANVNPTPSQPVKDAQNPSVGSTSFCHSGATTYEHCGHHLVSETGSFCDPQGNCTQLLDVYEDGFAPQGGDSGAPMFNYPASGGVIIRSVLIGGGATIYAEKWSSLQLHFNVSIVTA